MAAARACDDPRVPMSALDQEGLRRLLRAGRGLVSRLDLDEMLEQLLRAACEVTGARYAAVGVLDAERRSLERFLTYGIDPEIRRRIGDLPRGRGVLGVLIDDPRPLRLTDVRDHHASFGFPEHHPPMTNFLGVPVVVRGEAWGNLYLTERAGGPFTEADQQAAVVLADWASIAVENARLHAAGLARTHELEHAMRRLEATTDLIRAVGGEFDVERVLQLVVERGQALVDARSVVLLLAEDDELRLAAASGQVASDALQARFPAKASALGEVLRAGTAERVDDVAARLRLADQDLGVTGAETALLVPLRYRDRRLGVLAAFDRLGPDPVFGDEDQALLEAFAAGAATAVATARTVAEDRLRRSLQAAEEERARWARELHDDTLQALGALRLLLAGAARSGDEATLRESVGRAVGQLEQDIRSLRMLVTELRPAALDELGLAPALEALADRFGAVAGVRIDARAELGERLEGEVETTVFRIVQEALSNAARHAGADHVEVRVAVDGDQVTVRVRDDGRGFDPEAPARGFGLTGMHERIVLAGGDLRIDSAPGEGTLVLASVPVSAGTRPAA